jgi:hypothetical protein
MKTTKPMPQGRRRISLPPAQDVPAWLRVRRRWAREPVEPDTVATAPAADVSPDNAAWLPTDDLAEDPLR